jgi:hypothetical protein
MSQQFLLPCSCGQKLVVSPAQAGGQVGCGCGKSLAVPTLRGLRELEIAPAGSPGKTKAGWSSVHGAVFAAGLVLAAAGVFLLAIHGLQYGQIMGFKLTQDYTPAVVSAEMARIDALTPLQAFEEWHENAEHGLGEQEAPPWLQYQKLADRNLSRMKLGAVALVAGLVLSFATLAMAPKTRVAGG